MSLETATFIEDLVETNPVGATDFVSQGDDHMRLLKTVLKNQFPNLGANAVTATALELNKLDGVTLTAEQINDAARKSAANTFTDNQTLSKAGSVSWTITNSGASITAFLGADGSQGYAGTSTAHPFLFYTNNVDRGGISAAGAWTVKLAGTGDSLTVESSTGKALAITSGAGSQAELKFSQTGQDAAYIYNPASSNLLSIYTNGADRVLIGAGVQVGAPTGGDKGAGTINAAADVHVNGEPLATRNLLRRVFSGAGSTQADDAGKCLYYTGSGGHTLTLDTDAPVTAVVMVMNAGAGNLTVAASSTLYWFNGAALPTGNRTLAPGAVVTAWQTASGVWEMWGTGVS